MYVLLATLVIFVRAERQDINYANKINPSPGCSEDKIQERRMM